MARQIDILMRANDYLRKLNKRIDPFSGEWLPWSSAARESDVSRLFFFCSRSLVQIINYDNPEMRPAFFITPEQAAQLRPADGSVGLSKLTESINRATDALECRALGTFTVCDWLGKAGFLRKYGRGPWRITPQGKEIGITPAGERDFTFNQNAQQFVIDHVQELAGFARENTGEGYREKVQIKDPGTLQQNAAAMRRLSEGLHPYRDEPLDGQDPLNQERLRKCFEYTAWALERALEAGYFTAKAPFALPQERWREIPVSREPVTLFDFAKAVNALLDDPTAVDGLTVGLANDYLISRGLEQRLAGDKGRRIVRPTPEGSALGIEVGEAMNERGKPYSTLLYSAEAQQYIVEHIGEIIELAAGRK